MSIVGMGRLCGPRSLRHRWSRRSASTTLRCVAAAVMVASVVVAGPATAVAQGEGFSDVSEGVHTPAIDALAEKGVFEGTLCGEGMFCPSEAIKRSEMAVWLIRALEDEELPAAGTTRFSDVDADQFWAPYVERLAELEITVGCRREPLRYCPDTSVNRGQMATFLVRAFDLEAAGPAGFVDTEGSTHEANIDALAAAGITVGCTRDPLQFCTGDPVRRSQMATFLARALGLVETPSTSAQQPEEEPEEEETGPAVVADPATVLTPGTYDFTIEGTGFDPSLTMYVLECTIPGDPLSHDTPADELDAAMAQVDRSDCDLSTAQPVSLDSSGSFSVERSATVGANFMWVAADAAETQTAGAPVLIVGYSAVSVGGGHFCGLLNDGTINCTGGNEQGQASAPDGVFTAVSSGHQHSCGLRTDGAIECWGLNNEGQSDAPGGNFVAVSGGALHSCGLQSDSTVRCWGSNGFGQSDVPARTRFIAVSAGFSHTCGLRTDGIVQCWGEQRFGLSDAPARARFSAVSAGGLHSCGLRTGGTIECWGLNIDADGNEIGQAEPPSGTFVAVSAGWLHSCGVRPDGTIQCWGSNTHGQTEPPAGTFSAIDTGGNFTTGSGLSCGLRTDAAVRCWGFRRASS